MPTIKVDHVVSASSEEKGYAASNILNEYSTKTWRCTPGGHDRVSLILQFSKGAKISSVDIGNNGSAFVEILVGRLSDNEQNYKVLLAMSSFMSPAEGRQMVSTNRVRIFSHEKFSTDVSDEKWDRVKIVCTQPFNKTAQYGLSFVKFTSPGETTDPSTAETSSASSDQESVKLGAFSLREEDDTPLKIGSYFAKRKDTPAVDDKPVTGVAAIRAASVKAESQMMARQSESPPAKRKIKPEKDDQPPEKKKPVTPSPTTNVVDKKKSVDVPKKSPAGVTSATPGGSTKTTSKAGQLQPSSSSKDTTTPKNSRPKSAESKGGDQSTSASSTKSDRPMSSVVFVISGIQNPMRSDLRDKAIEMGAKYRPDWDDSCTHLVCAYTNTPKFNQVKKLGGSIVNQQWILDCYKKKTALPWKQYRLRDGSRSPSPPDTPATTSTSTTKTPTKTPTKSPSATTSKNVDSGNSSKPAPVSRPNKDGGSRRIVSDDEYGGSTDVDSDDDEVTADKGGRSADGEASTRAKNGKPAPSHSPPSPPVDTSTLPFPQLPDYFRGKCFFLYGKFDSEERRRLTRYITAFNGSLAEYMDATVRYVITCSEWDDNFDEALANNDSLIFVKPRWIDACATQKRLVPYQSHVVAPRDDS